ncbi:MAG: hypothetical protein IJ862_01685 [Selenomonadaceae bacterium]|nr:hypothetical protein [Selenomonadaceae bacterium]
MFKRFCLAFAIMMFIMSSGQTSAEEINADKINAAFILDTPSGKFSEPEKVYASFQSSMDKIFNDDPQFNIIPFNDTDPYVQIYREENDLTFSVDDDYTQVSNRDVSLKKKDIDSICKYFNADYVIYVRVTSTAPRFYDGAFTVSKKINITLDFRIWSDKRSDFVYAKRAVRTGASTSVYLGSGSAARAVDRGVKKCLKDIEKDSHRIKVSMS